MALSLMAELARAAQWRGSVQTLVVLMVLISILGVLWAVMLLRRARDWRITLLTIVMALVPIYQTMVYTTEIGIWNFSAATQFKVFADLLINVLFLIAVFLLEFAIEKRYSAEVRARVLEPGLTIERHQPALPDKLRHKSGLPQAQ